MQTLAKRPLRSVNACASGLRPASVALGASKEAPAPFKKLLAANRGEIALRIMRAATEMDMNSIGIFAFEDRYGQHRYKADQSFMLDRTKSPVAAYLDIDTIVRIAKENGVDAIHPGYGFLSENPKFAKAVRDAGITFVGPTAENLRMFADKTSARNTAIRCGVPVIPGTDGPVSSVVEARAFADHAGFPIMIKAAMGGGGRGMRVVRSAEELEPLFLQASREAEQAFGDGTMFMERFVEKPRHIEVQILGDSAGNVVHLFERDCSVQRRHQKVVEIAPAKDLAEDVRQSLLADAVRLCKESGYVNAGTVEFLVDPEGRYYFLEVNPRIQVEHTVTEEVTGIDIVQAQVRIAGGATLPELGLTQDRIKTNGFAIQCRITTENPLKQFQPDSGILEVYRNATGNGIRLDGIGFVGAAITPHYDSLLVKVTGKARTFEETTAKLRRALREFRIRGVSTNIPFLVNVLSNPAFTSGPVDTGFIDDHPELFTIKRDDQNRANRILRYLGDLAVNGRDRTLGATGPAPAPVDPVAPAPTRRVTQADGLRDVFVREGPEAFARAVRDHKGVLITDTTWRDAHQSLLATRVRTRDICAVAPATADALSGLYSLENWGGATFDVSMRFLHECPWDRLGTMRELVPNVPFQMLLRGANAVGYTSYPDNAVFRFCDLAKQHGMDVFRVFDSLNYVENMRLGIDAVGQAGGIVEAAVCYTGDVCDPRDGKYNLEYYLELVRELKRLGTHVLAIKDMAGLLKPRAAKLLVSAIREEFPDLPIHVHTHDTAGTGVASMIAAAEAGADAVDAAIDAMSGTTSQPSMGAIVAALKGTPLDTGIDLKAMAALNDYWEEARGVYAPFESGQKTGSADVYEHEMPGGQYTNLLFQSQQLGLTGRWPAIKRAYADANRMLGDIVKVTPSSKVVGDLAQFLVANNLTGEEATAKASDLSLPQSVVEYFQGYLGVPHGGFPEPLRSNVLKGRTLPNGKQCFEGRPGAEMDAVDFDMRKRELEERHGWEMRDVDVMSSVMYPKVFDEWQEFVKEFGMVTVLPTRAFVEPMSVGDEISFDLEHGKTLFVKVRQIGQLMSDGHREVTFDMNGEKRVLRVPDRSADVQATAREKAQPGNAGHLGAPMPGVVVDLKVKEGDVVKAGQPLCTLSAMKMETAVTASKAGRVRRLTVAMGDSIEAGDLVVELDTEKAE